jgi:hypothetical protein
MRGYAEIEQPVNRWGIQMRATPLRNLILRGVARWLKEIDPQVNLLFLDLDAGGSKVNLINQAHIFVEQAKASV